MSGGGGKSQTTTQTNNLPAWLDNQSQENLQQANVVAGRDFAQYEGPRVAGFSGDQTAAQAAVRNMQGQTAPALTDLAGRAGQIGQGAVPQVTAGTIPGTDLSQYMNPYLGAVEQSSLGLMNDARLMASNTQNAKAAGAGAFGGSRQAIQQAVTDTQFGRQAGDLSNQIRAAGYTQAQNAATSDLNRGLAAQTTNAGNYLTNQGQSLSGINAAGNLTQAAQTAGYTDANALAQSGLQQQQLTQAGYDVDAQKWQNEWNYPQQQLDIKMAALKGVPYATSSSTTGPAQGGSPAMGALGGAMSGAAAGSVAGPWGTAIGAGVGAIGGYMGTRR